ncbi:hypothetical protein KZJ38_01650 [Paraburkholderia edwinii]|jgi:hypothetical protein|uniref:Uncharacterized protein n=1 Tax=Paraburkholderia edwinii TaxID=2861782 RepID=A0ABX8UQ61_9BURK|nr:hypothetical protein [Paraburkholderia edwinii]QYD69129.1 hypothetical protein KZJ38_01650 [Paraburkholderia edwinii]
MEKWWVVAAIWTMCAMCAVLFIRGAAGGAARGERKPSRNIRSGQARVRG